jgi:hypothetical protein
VYVLSRDGRLIQHHEIGSRLPFDVRPIQLRTLAVPLVINTGEALQVYLRFKSHDGFHDMALPTLWQPKTLMSHLQANDWMTGICVGVMLSVLIYNALLFATTGIATFAYYTAFSSFLIWWVLTFQGLTGQYLWPQHPHLNKQGLLFSGHLAYVFLCAFALQYGKAKRHISQGLLRILQWLMSLLVLLTLPILWGSFKWPYALGAITGSSLMIVLLLAGGIAIKAGSRPARYMLLAFGILAACVMVYYLMVLKLLPADLPIHNLIPLGAAIQSLVLAWGLGSHLNTLRTQKRDAVQHALDAQTALTTQL